MFFNGRTAKYTVVHLHFTEYYLSIKSNELSIHKMTWMDQKKSRLSGKKPVPKGYTYMIPFIEHF